MVVEGIWEDEKRDGKRSWRLFKLLSKAVERISDFGGSKRGEPNMIE